MINNWNGTVAPYTITLGGISGYVLVMFQLTFAIISPALMTGLFVGRMRFKPYVIFTFLCSFAHGQA